MRYPRSILLFGFLLMISCTQKSEFLQNCECEKVDLKNGVIVNGHSERYSIVLPDTTWLSQVWKTGLSAATFEGNDFKYFGITEMYKAKPWGTLEEHQQDIDNKYNVIESGVIDAFEKESIWSLVDGKFDSIPTIGLYVTVEHPKENLFYTLDLAVSTNRYGKREICELENIVLSFKMN